MHKLKWLIVIIVGALLLLPLASNVVNSQDSESATNYIVVTLEGLTSRQMSPSVAPIELKLMLGAVTASGNRVQKASWPTAIWADAFPGGSLFERDHSAVPLFALPEDELGAELGFALIALDNRVPDDQFPEDWLSNSMPAVIEAASNPLALWVAGQALSPDEEAKRVEEAIESQLGGNNLLGVLAAKFAAGDDWGVRDELYEVSADDGMVELSFQYRIRRVSLPKDASVTARLQKIRVEGTGRSGGDQAQVLLWAKGASDFTGENLNGLLRRLPFVDTYELAEGDAQSLDEILYSSDLGPFLYLDLGVWDRRADGSRSMGMLTSLWTIEELANAPPGAFVAKLEGPRAGEAVTLSLAVEVSGLSGASEPQSVAVLELSATALLFQAEEGGTSPAPQEFQIRNAGDGVLNWSISTDQPWLRVQPASGVAPSTVMISATASGLAAGSFQGRIVIEAPGARNSPTEVPVTLTVTARSNEPPVASFQIRSAAPTAGETVTFDGSSSHDPDGSIKGYEWYFGDGSTGSGRIVTHIYRAAGMFTAILRVSDDKALDGWLKQKCFAHFVRELAKLEGAKTRGAVRFPRALLTVLREALKLREEKPQLSQSEFQARVQRLERRLDAQINAGRRFSDPDNARLAKRLRRQRAHLFTFLSREGVEATNNRAERALRPAVIVRKTGGCNRQPSGAKTHAILASLLVTVKQQGGNPLKAMARILTGQGKQLSLQLRSPPATEST